MSKLDDPRPIKAYGKFCQQSPAAPVTVKLAVESLYGDFDLVRFTHTASDKLVARAIRQPTLDGVLSILERMSILGDAMPAFIAYFRLMTPEPTAADIRKTWYASSYGNAVDPLPPPGILSNPGE